MRKKPKDFIDHGIDFGHLIEGWNIEDYIKDASGRSDGYETVVIHGIQGSGKSSRALQMASWIFEKYLEERLGRPPTEDELWNAVLDCLVFKPSDFVTRLEGVPDEDPLPVLIWDDIQAHYTSSTFKTDIEQYAAIDATWAVIRTKVKVVIITIPNISRLARNVKDNLTFEVYVGKNRVEQVRRIFRLPGTKHVDSNAFKPVLGKNFKFDLYYVPQWAWSIYEKHRYRLTNEALAGLRGVTDMEDNENYTPVWDVSKLLTLNSNTLQQMGSRSTIPTKKVNGVLCIPNDFIPELLEMYGKDA